MSLPLQLTDMVALTVRKHAESIEGAEMKSFDAGAFDLVRPLIYTADEKFDDVMEWLTGEEKKKRPGT